MGISIVIPSPSVTWETCAWPSVSITNDPPYGRSAQFGSGGIRSTGQVGPTLAVRWIPESGGGTICVSVRVMHPAPTTMRDANAIATRLRILAFGFGECRALRAARDPGLDGRIRRKI